MDQSLRAAPDLLARAQALLAADRHDRLGGADRSCLEIPLPPPEVWRQFLENLAHARAVADDPQATRGDLQGVTIAAMAVIDLLNHSRAPDKAEPLLSPLWRLVEALHDVYAGASPPLFLPTKQAKPGLSLERDALRMTASLAVQELLDSGESLPGACLRAARDLGRHGVTPRHGASLAATVKGWRERLMETPRFADSLQQWRTQFREATGREGTPAERGADLLKMIRSETF